MNYKTYRFIILFLIFLGTGNVYAQDNSTFNIASSFISYQDLNIEQQEKYNSFHSKISYNSSQFVQIGDLASSQVDGVLAVSLPNLFSSFDVNARIVEYTDSDNYTWFGKGNLTSDFLVQNNFINSDEEFIPNVELDFLMSDGVYTGFIKSEYFSYSIQSFDDGKSFLIENPAMVDGRIRGRCEPVWPSSEDEIPVLDYSTFGNSRNFCPVKVLALYTEGAENTVVNIDRTIRIAMKGVEKYLSQSGIVESDFFIDLIDERIKINFDEGEGSTRANVDELIALSNGWRDIREQYSADIVVVFAYGDEYEDSGIGGSAGNLIQDADDAIAVISVLEAANGTITLAHEIAHLFGCQHERSQVELIDANLVGDIEHCHVMNRLKSATIMASGPTLPFERETPQSPQGLELDNQLEYFSSPDISLEIPVGNTNTQPTPIGIENSTDNVKHLKGTGCFVANYRDDPNIAHEIYAALIGPSFGCPCSAVVLSYELIGNPQGPVTVTWETSLDGIIWQPVGTNNQPSISVNLPCTEGGGVFVRLTAIPENGQNHVTTTFIEATLDWYGQIAPCPRSVEIGDNEEEGDNFLYFNIFPNPSQRNITIQGFSKKDDNKLLRILDLSGRLVLSLKSDSIENGSMNVDISKLQKGNYIVSLDKRLIGQFLKL